MQSKSCFVYEPDDAALARGAVERERRLQRAALAAHLGRRRRRVRLGVEDRRGRQRRRSEGGWHSTRVLELGCRVRVQSADCDESVEKQVQGNAIPREEDDGGDDVLGVQQQADRLGVRGVKQEPIKARSMDWSEGQETTKERIDRVS